MGFIVEAQAKGYERLFEVCPSDTGECGHKQTDLDGVHRVYVWSVAPVRELGQATGENVRKVGQGSERVEVEDPTMSIEDMIREIDLLEHARGKAKPSHAPELVGRPVGNRPNGQGLGSR